MVAKLAYDLSDKQCAGFWAHDLLEIIDNLLSLLDGQPRGQIIFDDSQCDIYYLRVISLFTQEGVQVSENLWVTPETLQSLRGIKEVAIYDP